MNHGQAESARFLGVSSLRLVRDTAAVCKQIRRIYKYICVDEFQDTNLSQYALLKCVVGEHQNLFVLADDDQIIYQ